jgi:chromosome condensin MukBEF MukE localization factor
VGNPKVLSRVSVRCLSCTIIASREMFKNASVFIFQQELWNHLLNYYKENKVLVEGKKN